MFDHRHVYTEVFYDCGCIAIECGSCVYIDHYIYLCDGDHCDTEAS